MDRESCEQYEVPITANVQHAFRTFSALGFEVSLVLPYQVHADQVRAPVQANKVQRDPTSLFILLDVIPESL
jgi:hypothetical protein